MPTYQHPETLVVTEGLPLARSAYDTTDPLVQYLGFAAGSPADTDLAFTIERVTADPAPHSEFSAAGVPWTTREAETYAP